MNDLSLRYASQSLYTSFDKEGQMVKDFKESSRKSLLKPNDIYLNISGNCDQRLYTDAEGKINAVVDYYDKNFKIQAIQELKDVEGVQFKTTKITPFQEGRDTYKSIQRLDRENGLYSVVRQNGDEIIGGYEVNLNKPNRTFATGFKGKLQKLALGIAQDNNGCERKGLRQIGEMIFKIVRKIK